MSTDGRPLVEHLHTQLGQAGAHPVTVTDDLAEVARLAETGNTPLLLCAADLVAHTAVLRHLATSPVGPTVALVLPDGAGPGRLAVEEDRGQAVAVRPVPGTPASERTVAGGTVAGGTVAGGTVHEGTGVTGSAFGGALRVGVADLPALAAAARSTAASTGGIASAGVTAASTGAGVTAVADPMDRLFAAFAATGSTIFTHRVRLLVALRVDDDAAVAAAEAAVAAVPSDPAELRLAVKERDDFFTTYFVSTWSPYVTRLAARLGLGPTQVTVISVVFAVAAAALFGLGGRPALVAGAVLLYLGFVLDCVDGQLARYTRQFSVWGGWLDTMADRAKEYVVYAGLAVGVERSGLGNGWALAIAAMTLQTVRHMTDTWYGALHDEAARRAGAGPSGSAVPAPGGLGTGGVGTGGVGGGGLGARLSRASTRVQADTGSVSYWLKRTVVFPIGERWALIAITVALFNPLVSLVAVLVWGALAAAYTLALRTLRSRSMRVAVLSTVDATLHRDDGLPARLLGRLGARLRWLPGPLPLAALATVSGAALLQTVVGGSGPGLRIAVGAALLVALTAALPSARPQSGPLDWLVPAALRATEYLFVIAIGYGFGVPRPLIFALIFVLALHHYNLTARLEKRERTPLLRSFGLGWDGRLILLTAVVLLGVAAVGFAVLAGYLLAISTLSAVTGWTVAARARRTAEAGSGADDILMNERQRAG